jgi:hypothetical protein
MDALKLIDTPLIVLPGMTETEIDAAWEDHVQRVKMTDQFLAGTIDPETYFDFMIEGGFEPEELMDEAEANLEFAIQQGLIIEK